MENGIIAAIGSAAAVTSFGVSLINTWRDVRKGRVKLKVNPGWVWRKAPFGEKKLVYAVEVVNLSKFPVVIYEIGFYLSGKEKVLSHSTQGIELEGKGLPLLLPPRTRCLKIFLDSNLQYLWPECKSVYVQTECGVTVKRKVR